MSYTKDLTKEAPTSPRVRIRGYALLARMADKGRAQLNGTNGEYRFNCRLDQSLFNFKEVDSEAVKGLLSTGASNEEIASWFDSNGAPKHPDEIKSWSDIVEGARPHEDPERREWFDEECSRLGLDPAEATLFDYLETDDRVSFKK